MPVVDTDSPPAADPATLPHNSRKNDVIATAVACLVIAAVFVALRLYTRIRISKSFGQSDWWLLASLVGSTIQSAWFIEQAIHGLGAHVWDIDLATNYIPLQKSAWFSILFYNLTLWFIKMSFLFLYLTIFTYTWSNLACRILLALVILAAIWTITVTATACIPLQAFWDLSIQGAYCHKTDMWWVNTGFHVVTDFAIFLVPLPQIGTMRIPKKQKIILIILFSLGFIVAFISIIRVIFLVDLHHTKDPDFTWVGARFGYLSTIELNAGIVVACLMTLKPLVNRVFPSMFAAPAAGPALTGPTPPTIGGTPPVLWKGSSNEAQSNDVAPWELEAQTSKAEGESKGTPSTSSS